MHALIFSNDHLNQLAVPQAQIITDDHTRRVEVIKLNILNELTDSINHYTRHAVTTQNIIISPASSINAAKSIAILYYEKMKISANTS